MDALYEALKAINRSVYPCCLEEYSVIDGMWAPSSLKSGAECGAKQETSGTFKSANPMTKLENAGIHIFRTDRDGTVTLTTDGSTYQIAKEH